MESIKIFGVDAYYIPKTKKGEDDIHNEVSYLEFNDAYLFEVYVKSLTNFEGDGVFLQKFNIEVRDQLTFTVSQRSFDRYVTEFNATLNRPREGDIIYIPMIGSAYAVSYVDPTALFYQLGKLQVYDVVCELTEFSNEVFNTGIAEIDDKYNAFSTDLTPDILTNEEGIPLTTEGGEFLTVDDPEVNRDDSFGDNEVIEEEADVIIDFDEKSPFGDI